MEINQSLQTVLLVLVAGMTLGFPALFFISRMKLQQEKKQLQDKLIALESEFLFLKQNGGKATASNAPAKKKANTSHDEVLALRKDLSAQKDEVKRLRKEGEEQARLSMEKYDELLGQYSVLKEENAQFLMQLQEAHKKPVVVEKEVSSPVKAMRSERQEAKNEAHQQKLINDFERRLKSMEERNQQLKEQLRQITIWKERAEAGKHFYRMMKNMKDLSEEKLVTYQQSVLTLAQHVLVEGNKTLPDVKQGENAVDRYLAAAVDSLSVGKSSRPDRPVN